MTDRSTRVKPYTWDQGKSTETDGAMVTSTRKFIFIARSNLRDVADQLHDLADSYDE